MLEVSGENQPTSANAGSESSEKKCWKYNNTRTNAYSKCWLIG